MSYELKDFFKEFGLNKNAVRSNLLIQNNLTRELFIIINKYERYKKYLLEFINIYIIQLHIENSDHTAQLLFLGVDINDLHLIDPEPTLNPFGSGDIERTIKIYTELLVNNFKIDIFDFKRIRSIIDEIFDKYVASNYSDANNQLLNCIIYLEFLEDYNIIIILNMGTIYEYRILRHKPKNIRN